MPYREFAQCTGYMQVKFGIPNSIPPDMGRYFSDTDRGIYCQKIRYTEKGVEEEEEEEEQ